MFAEHFADALSRAQFHELNDLAHKLWKSHAAGHLDDDQAQRLAERLEAKRSKPGAGTSFKPPKAPRIRQRSPDKQRSIDRRRRLAKCSPVPPELVDRFTQCELAVIYIVVDEILKHGRCGLYVALIAARAGTCNTVVREAIRKARDAGLLYRHERRRKGQKSKSNVIFILNKRWGVWLRNVWDRRRPIRPEAPASRKTESTEDKVKKEGNAGGVDRSGEAYPTPTGEVGRSERSEVSRA
jgi:hypothetical protein